LFSSNAFVKRRIYLADLGARAHVGACGEIAACQGAGRRRQPVDRLGQPTSDDQRCDHRDAQRHERPGPRAALRVAYDLVDVVDPCLDEDAPALVGHLVGPDEAFGSSLAHDLERCRLGRSLALVQEVRDDAPLGDIFPGAKPVRVAAREDLSALVHREQQVAGFLAQRNGLPYEIQVDQCRQHSTKRAGRDDRSGHGQHRGVGTVGQQRVGQDRSRRIASALLPGMRLGRASQRRREERLELRRILAIGHRLDGVAQDVAVADVGHPRVGYLAQDALDLLRGDRAAASHGGAQRLGHAQHLGTQTLDVKVQFVRHRRDQQHLVGLLMGGKGQAVGADEVPRRRDQRDDADRDESRQDDQGDVAAAAEAGPPPGP
jgi:hypothetical protein